MDDLISRQAVIEKLRKLEFSQHVLIGGREREVRLIRAENARDAIKALASVDAAPVKHGYWICHRDELDGDTAECSVCHAEGMLYGDYCVNCGAIMDAVPPRLKNG